MHVIELDIRKVEELCGSKKHITSLQDTNNNSITCEHNEHCTISNTTGGTKYWPTSKKPLRMSLYNKQSLKKRIENQLSFLALIRNLEGKENLNYWAICFCSYLNKEKLRARLYPYKFAGFQIFDHKQRTEQIDHTHWWKRPHARKRISLRFVYLNKKPMLISNCRPWRFQYGSTK